MASLPSNQLPADQLLAERANAWALKKLRTIRSVANSLITERDLERMGLAKLRTIRGWRHEGRGPRYIKIERAVRYRLIDVLEYLNTRPSGGRVIAKPPDTATESK